MPAKAKINDGKEFTATHARFTPQITMHERTSASASSLMPSELVLERQVTEPASPDAFEAAVASPGEANVATAHCTFQSFDGTSYKVNVEEGTVVGWRVSQADQNAPVLETVRVLARKSAVEIGESGEVNLEAV